MSSNAEAWRAARALWPAGVSGDPELGEPQLSEQLGIARAFVAEHLVISEVATVCLSALKVAGEVWRGDWVSQTVLLATLIAGGFEIQKGRRGAIFVRCAPRNLWLVRALRRGRFPTHAELTEHASHLTPQNRKAVR